LLNVVFAEYEKSWKPVYEMKFEYIRSEMNSQFANIATPSEIVVAATFTLEFGGSAADMHVCFPYSMVEPIRDLLYSTMQSDHLTSDTRWISTLKAQLKDAEVPLTANFAHASLPLRHILKLQKGDVITLSVPDTVVASVDNVPLLECTYGQQSGRYAIKVDRFIEQNSGTPADNGEEHGR
jgi:flagellar motor switch protein FliM